MNKTILITGASSGIGEGCARKFASQGARLILNARSTDKLTALAKELKEKYNADCYVMPFDVCDRESAVAALNALPEEWKSIDVLINNAGLAIGVDKEHEWLKNGVLIPSSSEYLLTDVPTENPTTYSFVTKGIYCKNDTQSVSIAVAVINNNRQTITQLFNFF